MRRNHIESCSVMLSALTMLCFSDQKLGSQNYLLFRGHFEK